MQDEVYQELRACTGKHDYGSMAAARQAAKRLSKKFNSTLMGYVCRYCGGFHVGNVRPPRRNTRR